MNGIKITPLFSGSGGNCTYIESEGAKILVDAGVCARRIVRALSLCETDIDEIDAIFITHEHSDHTSGLRVLCNKRNIPVHITRPSFHALPFGIPAVTHDVVFTVNVGDLTVKSFPLSHDTACCVGYTFEKEGEKVSVMTDTGYVTDEAVYALAGSRRVLIECNHDISMLRRGSYPRYLKDRILSKEGHLSNDDCAAFCAFLASHGTEDFILAHLSKENNTPDLAGNTVKARLEQKSLSANVCVAAPEII